MTIGELSQWSERRCLLESFGVGTAVCVAPVRSFVRANGKEVSCARTSWKTVDFARKIRSTIIDIQTGQQPHVWSLQIDTVPECTAQ